MKYIIDRFEGDFAIVELADKTFSNIPRINDDVLGIEYSG